MQNIASLGDFKRQLRTLTAFCNLWWFVSSALRMPIQNTPKLLSGQLLCIVVLDTDLHRSERWQPAPGTCSGVNLVTQGPLLQVRTK